MQRRCVVLLSGGLDSILAARLMLEQGIETYGFHAYQPWDEGVAEDVKETAEELGIPLKSVLLYDEFIEMIKNPDFGYGRNLNPCIDCKIVILKKAKEYMHEIGASFIVTGEVVGQRPMSQKRHMLDIIEERSGLKGCLLRPLCAKCLPVTKVEEEGIVDREKLMQITGRSRKEQLGLVKKFGVKQYRTPAGGCLLTDDSFSQRLADLLKHDSGKIPKEAFELLKLGRHFRFSPSAKVILGRDEAENTLMERFEDFADEFIMPEFSGPTAIISGEITEDVFLKTVALICAYTSSRQYGLVEQLEFYTPSGKKYFNKEDVGVDEARKLRDEWKLG